MIAAAQPPDERERLAALREHAILDTAPEVDFDRLAREAAELCATPIALVTLVDEQRQWFKARVGLAARETPREQAFCAHAILDAQIFEVPDAALDERFVDNPLVVGDPNIRFYAGVPLVAANGHALGTLCVIDRVPRRLDDIQRDGLRALGEQVIGQLEARRRLRLLARPDTRTVREPGVGATVHAALDAADRPNSEPRRCGRFTILRRIGEGGMATVYAAHDAELERDIAVKLMHDAGDPDTRARVRREAQALARISHPNVVQIFEIGAYGAQVFVAMELIAGPSLSAWNSAQARSLAEIVAMFVQAGRGLVAAHRAGIIHRDFKADNVIVGPDGRARVVDFGLARVLSAGTTPTVRAQPGAGSPHRTEAGMIMGTPAYMSPEQHRSAAVDERSDQFNFCAALYEAIYRVRPFAGPTIDELRVQVALGVIVEPPGGRTAPSSLHHALLRGLAPQPDLRWPSLSQLLDELERFEETADPAREHTRRRVAAGLLGLMLVVAGAMVTGSLVAPGSVAAPRLLSQAAVVLLFGLGCGWLVRDSLLREPLHRRMFGVALFVMVTGCVARGFGLVTALSVPEIVRIELLMAATTLAALACFVQRGLWAPAAIGLAGAALVGVGGLPGPLVAGVAYVAGTLLFVREWRQAARMAAVVGRARPGL